MIYHASASVYPWIYHGYTMYMIQSDDGYTLYIQGYTMYIPCICGRSTYTWYIRHIPGIYRKSGFQMESCTVMYWYVVCTGTGVTYHSMSRLRHGTSGTSLLCFLFCFWLCHQKQNFWPVEKFKFSSCRQSAAQAKTSGRLTRKSSSFQVAARSRACPGHGTLAGFQMFRPR
jgi:hypothetical protein